MVTWTLRVFVRHIPCITRNPSFVYDPENLLGFIYVHSILLEFLLRYMNQKTLLGFIYVHFVPKDWANGRGVTSLMQAALRDQVEVVRLLLDAGADTHVAKNNGDTALTLASRYLGFWDFWCSPFWEGL